MYINRNSKKVYIGKGGDCMYVNKREVAKFLGLSVSMINKLVLSKKIPFYKMGAAVRFNLDEIKKWVEERKEGGEKNNG